MAEKVNKLILETEFKTTGTVEGSVSKVEQLQEATKQAAAGTLQLVEAEKKLEKAAAQSGVAVTTQTKKTNDLNTTFKKTGETMQKIGQINTLKNIAPTLDQAIARTKQFTTELLKTGGAGAQFEKVTKEFEQFVDSLPTDIKNNVLDQLGSDAKKLTTAIERPVSRLRELKRLINTETDPVVIRKLQIEAGKLQDQLGDTNELLRALASDTFFTDSLVEGIQTATGAFATFQGVAGLLADDQQAFAEASAKAQSALALLQGVQQLSIALKKEDNILTRAQIIGQKAYTLVVGESTGALKGFRLALAATGIGLLIVAIGLLIANFEEIKSVLGFGVNPELERNAKLTRDAAAANRELLQASQDKEAFEKASGVDEEQRLTTRKELLEANVKTAQAAADAELKILQDLEAKKNQLTSVPGLGLVQLNGISDKDIQDQKEKFATARKDLFDLATQSKNVSDQLKEIEEKRTADIKEQFDKQADNRLTELNERERHALAVLNIEKASDEEQLKERIAFQQKRVALLQQQKSEDPEFDNKTLVNARNILKELKLELDAIPTGTIPTLNRQLAELRENLFGGNLIAGTTPYNQAVEDLNRLEEKLRQVTDEINPQNTEIIVQGSIAQLEKTVSDLEVLLRNVEVGSQEQELFSRLIADAKKQLSDAEKILNPETKRSQLLEILSEQERHELAMLSLKANSEREQLQVQLRYAKLKRDALLLDDEATEAQKLQANNVVIELEEQLNKRLSEIDKARVDRILSHTQTLINDAANLANTLLSIELKKNDALIAAQQDRVAAAEKIADRGNANLLQLEQQRLDDLNKQRAKFVRDQQKLAAAQIIIESMLAIAKAAAQGGAAAPFTIAATLIALAAGLAQARAAATASTQSFKKGGISKGGYTGDGPPDGQSLKLGEKNYVYHNREHITPADVLSIGKNAEWLEKIRLERLDIGQLIASKKPANLTVLESHHNSSNVSEPVTINMNLNSKGIISIIERNNNRRVKLRTRK